MIEKTEKKKDKKEMQDKKREPNKGKKEKKRKRTEEEKKVQTHSFVKFLQHLTLLTSREGSRENSCEEALLKS